MAERKRMDLGRSPPPPVEGRGRIRRTSVTREGDVRSLGSLCKIKGQAAFIFFRAIFFCSSLYSCCAARGSTVTWRDKIDESGAGQNAALRPWEGIWSFGSAEVRTEMCGFGSWAARARHGAATVGLPLRRFWTPRWRPSRRPPARRPGRKDGHKKRQACGPQKMAKPCDRPIGIPFGVGRQTVRTSSAIQGGPIVCRMPASKKRVRFERHASIWNG